MSEKTQLALILERFMTTFNLSQREASSASGLAPNTLRSALSGTNVNTGGKFRPRDATLRHVAASINAYALSKDSNFRVTFEQLRDAAGQPAGESDQGDQPESAPHQGIAALPDVPGSAHAGYIPWTEAEKDVLVQAYEVGAPLAGPFDPKFRRLEPARRAAQFEVYRGVIARYREFLRQQQGNGQE